MRLALVEIFRAMGWTRRRKMWIILSAVIMASAIVTVAILLWVPIAQEQTGYTFVGSQFYTFESVNVFNSPSSDFTYRGMVFDFYEGPDCPQNAGGGALCGSVLQPNGVNVSFMFTFSPPYQGLGPWSTWVSPNHQEAIEI
jgi:hypothetical protein